MAQLIKYVLFLLLFVFNGCIAAINSCVSVKGGDSSIDINCSAEEESINGEKKHLNKLSVNLLDSIFSKNNGSNLSVAFVPLLNSGMSSVVVTTDLSNVILKNSQMPIFNDLSKFVDRQTEEAYSVINMQNSKQDFNNVVKCVNKKISLTAGGIAYIKQCGSPNKIIIDDKEINSDVKK